MLDWKKYKLESRLLGEMSINSDMQMTPPLSGLPFPSPVDHILSELSTMTRPSWVASHGRGTRDQIGNIRRIMDKAREFQKNIYFCFIDYARAFDFVGHNKLWKILKEMRIPDHLTCLLKNLYAGQEAPVRTRHGTTDWFQIGKRVSRLYIATLLI